MDSIPCPVLELAIDLQTENLSHPFELLLVFREPVLTGVSREYPDVFYTLKFTEQVERFEEEPEVRTRPVLHRHHCQARRQNAALRRYPARQLMSGRRLRR